MGRWDESVGHGLSLAKRWGARGASGAGALCLGSRAFAADEESLHDLFVEMAAASFLEEPEGLLRRHRVAVVALGGHRFEEVGHGDDLGTQRDILSLESLGVAGPVDLSWWAPAISGTWR